MHGSTQESKGTTQENRRNGILRCPFHYIDTKQWMERFVGVRKQGGSSLIPEGTESGTLHTVSTGAAGMLGLYALNCR